MSRRPIGETAMTGAERSARKRAKAKALRNGAPMQPAPADYPRMLYHADGRMIVVDTPAKHEALTPDGWVITPLPVHLQRPVWHHGIPRRQ